MTGGVLAASVFALVTVLPGDAAADPTAKVGADRKVLDDPRVAPAISERMTVIADRDDDDADDRPDGDGPTVSPAARVDLVALDPRFAGSLLFAVSGREHARLVANGKVVPWGEKIPAGTQVQGISAGHLVIDARTGTRDIGIDVAVHGVSMRDGAKHAVDMARMHASIERTPPTRVDFDNPEEAVDDPDAMRVVVASPEGTSLGPVSVESVNADGASLDALNGIHLGKVACDGEAAGTTCLATVPLRFVVDDVDKNHPLVNGRSLRAEVGGAIVVRDAHAKKLQAIRVAGPRAGNIGRHRLAIRPVVMRMSPGGAPSVGGTDAGALAALRQELSVASATWGQCGITFGSIAQLDVKLVSPPPPYLLAIGDDIGLPASGGELRLKAENRSYLVKTKVGWSTRQVALEVQRVLERGGLKATLSENARIASGATPSVDVAVRRADGQLATVEIVSSSDATLSVAVGAVDLADGLQHFGDTDSVAGTLEERALVKAVDDGDPRTIEVIVVPYFAGGGRIGESFIGSDGSSMRNVVIIDRAGVRARRTSLTLAHELGHVILDEPGHPDDYGIDTPTLLMDSDASDASPFGPRRLTTADCQRAVRQSGPAARVPLLTEWKLSPIHYR